MYRILICALAAFGTLIAQAPAASDTEIAAKLNPLVSAAIRRSATIAETNDKLTNALMAIARSGSQPSRELVASFVSSLADFTSGRQVDSAHVSALSECMADMLRGSGVTNFGLARQLRTTLTELGVTDAKLDPITRQFIAIGEAVRGPDDMPANDRIRLLMAPKK